MAFTSPPTFVSGATLTAAQLNILGDDLNYLKGISDGVTISGVQLSRVTNQGISDSVDTTVSFTAEAFDYGSWASAGATATVPAGAIPAGYTSIGILCFGRNQFATNATGVRRLRTLKDGTYFGSRTLGGVSGDVTDVQITEFTTATVGQALTVTAYQTSGGSLNLAESNITWLRYAPAS